MSAPVTLTTLLGRLQAASLGDPTGFADILPALRPTCLPPAKALYIHTATVTTALSNLLAEAYPATRTRMGETAFATATRQYVLASPPDHPVLSGYGHGFADSLEPELALIAAADWSAHQAYFAADMIPAGPDILRPEAPEDMAGLCLTLVPSARILSGTADIFRQWQEMRTDLHHTAHADPDAANSLLVWRGPDLLVTSTLLLPGERALVMALTAGHSLLTAMTMTAGSPPFDLSLLLALLLTRRIVAVPPPGS